MAGGGIIKNMEQNLRSPTVPCKPAKKLAHSSRVKSTAAFSGSLCRKSEKRKSRISGASFSAAFSTQNGANGPFLGVEGSGGGRGRSVAEDIVIVRIGKLGMNQWELEAEIGRNEYVMEKEESDG